MVDIKEESKYYAPTIEEFHVGFEYEQREMSISDSPKVEWERRIFEVAELDTNVYRKLNLELVRVKCLDKEDIESLGFVEEPGQLERGYTKAFQKYSDPIRTGCTINIDEETGKCEIWYGMFNSYAGVKKFKGYIKNKSELIKLLKQIKVDESII